MSEATACYDYFMYVLPYVGVPTNCLHTCCGKNDAMLEHTALSGQHTDITADYTGVQTMTASQKERG